MAEAAYLIQKVADHNAAITFIQVVRGGIFRQETSSEADQARISS